MLAAAILLLLQGTAVAAEEPAPPPPGCNSGYDRAHGRSAPYPGLRVCAPLSEPREIRGIWHHIFEGSRFFEDATYPVTVPDESAAIWLDVRNPIGPDRLRNRRLQLGHAYEVRFIGRATPVLPRGRGFDRYGGLALGYGHLGQSDGLVVVDEFLTITDLGPITP
jgi:hypothetical protein